MVRGSLFTAVHLGAEGLGLGDGARGRLHPRSAQDSGGRVGRVAPSARTEPVRRLAPAAASGVATSSSDLPSASTARNQATSPPTIITPAPSKYPRNSGKRWEPSPMSAP